MTFFKLERGVRTKKKLTHKKLERESSNIETYRSQINCNVLSIIVSPLLKRLRDQIRMSM